MATFQFIAASHDEQILNTHLLRPGSDGTRWLDKFFYTIIKDQTNVARAYNAVPVDWDFAVYIHHDVYLPPSFEQDLKDAIQWMEFLDPNFGVLGVAGVRTAPGYTTGKIPIGYILDRGKQWGAPIERPKLVHTLDEMLLITRGDFKFDENLEQDYYGADICMQAIAQGRENYVIPGFCHHNSGREFGGRTDSFYRSEEYFKNKWKDHLPIATTCSFLKKP